MKSSTYTTYERRQSARHKVQLPVDLILADGTLLPVESTNISGTGLQVVCGSWVVDEIEPRGIQLHATSHLRLKAIIELTGQQTNNKLFAQCKIISAQRLSQDKYNLNLNFTGFENGSESALDNFLNQFQQKKTVIKATA